jgi:hypothetical protein
MQRPMLRPIARKRYRDQKNNSIKRNIEFSLTFEEWDSWWLSHGVDKNLKTGNRAVGSSLCMCRNLDQGPYCLGNIYCDTLSNNTSFAHTYQPDRTKAAAQARKKIKI